MKLFQKTYPLVGIMLLMSSGIFLARAEDFPVDKLEQLSLIEAAQTAVFGKDNLFAEENKDIHIWFQMINDLQDYVDENADGNKKLIKAFETCRSVSSELIGTILIVYDSVFTGELSFKERGAWNKARSKIGRLIKRKKDLEKESKTLKNTRFYFSAQKKNDAKEVLLRLIESLKVILDRLDKNFSEEYWTAEHKYSATIPAAEHG